MRTEKEVRVRMQNILDGVITLSDGTKGGFHAGYYEALDWMLDGQSLESAERK